MIRTHKALSDDQYLKIEELALLENDIRRRIEECIRTSGQDAEYNVTALRYAQMKFYEAFIWARDGISNKGVCHQDKKKNT